MNLNQIRRQDDKILVNNNTYRVNISGAPKNLTKTQRVAVADAVLQSLQNTHVNYQNLDNTVVTAQEVETDQQRRTFTKIPSPNPAITTATNVAIPAAGNAQSQPGEKITVTFSDEDKVTEFVQSRLKMPRIIQKMRNGFARVFAPTLYERERNYSKIANLEAAESMIRASNARMA